MTLAQLLSALDAAGSLSDLRLARDAAAMIRILAAERDAQHAEIKRLRALLREAQLWVREYDGVNEYDCGELDADCLYCRIVAALGEREL